jgi:tetratricopeptide (TPR) repeat protein
MGLFESLRLIGITYTEDPSAPYKECRTAPNRLDYIQYPYQTFAYNGGDSDDLSLLFISTLSSVGLKTAFIPLPDRAYAAFALDASEDEARKFFSDPSLFAWKNGKAWVVVDTTRVREGFLAAWHAGAQAWNAAVTAGDNTYFYPMESAWAKYKPIGIIGTDVAVSKPREDRLRLAFENTIGRFVSSEIDPRVKRMKEEMGVSGGTPRQLNILGILYARYGLLEDAKKTFNQAVEKGSKTSVINLANVDFLLKNYKEAAQLYESILKDDPENKAALIGLAKARYEMDAYAETDDLYARINQLDPELAAKYSYLSSRIDSGPTRAGSANEQRETVPWVDGE